MKHLVALNAFDGHVGAYYEALKVVGDENDDGVLGIVQVEGAELVTVGVAVVVDEPEAVDETEVIGVTEVDVDVAAAAAVVVEGKMMGEVLW